MFESIWTGQSILSACTDIYQLHFVRWNKEEEWTPWNTLLLTLDEAESHFVGSRQLQYSVVRVSESISRMISRRTVRTPTREMATGW